MLLCTLLKLKVELTLRVLERWDSRLHRCPVVDAEVPVLLEQGYPPWPTSVKS